MSLWKRKATSPVGPIYLVCECRHLWSNHDDNGCLWRWCRCLLPGERK